MNVRCSQCGATISAPPDASLLQCPYCDTALVLSGGDTLFRVVMPPTVGAQAAVDHLKRFMAGRKTVAGLDREAKIGAPTLIYFPFWAFRIETGDGEKVVLEPAAPSSVQGLQGMVLPPGESTEWSEEVTAGAPVVGPEIPLETARQWMNDRFDEPTVRRAVLYHLPVYRMSYDYRGRTYRAAVDAVTGKVFPADYPAKAEAPFIGVTILAIALFSIEGIVVSSLLLKAMLYAVTSIPLFGLAWWVSKKV